MYIVIYRCRFMFIVSIQTMFMLVLWESMYWWALKKVEFSERGISCCLTAFYLNLKRLCNARPVPSSLLGKRWNPNLSLSLSVVFSSTFVLFMIHQTKIEMNVNLTHRPTLTLRVSIPEIKKIVLIIYRYAGDFFCGSWNWQIWANNVYYY